MQHSFKRHLRNAFITGIFSAIPIVITAVVVWYVEKLTREPITALFGVDTPFIGIAAAIVGIYLLGVLVNSLLGRYILRGLDALLRRVPILRDVYEAWRQVILTPGGKEGIYANVVLVPTSGDGLAMGFTSGEPVEGNPDLCCVFVPGTPNPTAGRLVFARRDKCINLGISAEEAFKFALSGGNYVPAPVGPLSAARLEP
ncbi:MAG TPA: DUF502 domain-containing protein [Nannocystis sp.]|jgi:uncharacterized membrane protein